MIAATLSRFLILLFGVLKPVYSSCKALNKCDERDIQNWLTYWIIFGIFTSVTAFTDVSFNWFPLYYELKVVFVKWLLSPSSNGALHLYTKFLKPFVDEKKDEIEGLIAKVEEHSWEHFIEISPKIVKYVFEGIARHIILPICYIGRSIEQVQVPLKEDSDDSIEDHSREFGKHKRIKLMNRIKRKNDDHKRFLRNINDISD